MMRNGRPLLVLVIAACGALGVATTVMARIHRQERAARAERHRRIGDDLLAAGAVAEAVPELRAALALEREAPEAARRLAQALFALGQLDAAESRLRDLIERDPVNGLVNRDMARVAAAKQRTAEARAHYQRAIYGEWPPTLQDERLETRFELAGHLRRTGDTEALVAELMLLKAEVPAGQTARVRRLADLLLEVRLPDQAVDVLARGVDAAPLDADLLAHRAEAELAAGRLADARATLRLAIGRDPKATGLRDRLAVIDRVLALDPTLPRLRLPERTSRARNVLSAVMSQVTTCGATLDPLPPEMRARVEPYLGPIRGAEAAEGALQLAAEIWKTAAVCHNDSAESLAIDRVLEAVARTRGPAS